MKQSQRTQPAYLDQVLPSFQVIAHYLDHFGQLLALQLLHSCSKADHFNATLDNASQIQPRHDRQQQRLL